ncbi:MAG: tRNA (guanosine(46)-N7)-methyltransferase TrmB, partial [Pseudomonadota bacterium]
ASIARAFLLYPDPWPKTRHHKRRFINPKQMDMLARVMATGAQLRVATDIADYVRHTLEVIDQDLRFTWSAERASDWRKAWVDWPGTRYEAKALREGRVPYYLTFQRT